MPSLLHIRFCLNRCPESCKQSRRPLSLFEVSAASVVSSDVLAAGAVDQSAFVNITITLARPLEFVLPTLAIANRVNTGRRLHDWLGVTVPQKIMQRSSAVIRDVGEERFVAGVVSFSCAFVDTGRSSS